MRKIALPHEGLDTLYGAHDANLKHIESVLNVAIRTHGDELIVEGDKSDEQRVERLFDQLTALMQGGYELGSGDVKTAAALVIDDPNVNLREYFMKDAPAGKSAGQATGTKRRVNPKSPNQKRYLETIEQNDIVFGVGPAGTDTELPPGDAVAV